MRSIRKVLAAIRKADETYGLIDDGDKILVGLSGGKDSFCLIKALSIYGLFAKKKFLVQPVTLDLGFPNFDPEPLKKYCSSIGYDLLVEDSRFVYDVLKQHQGNKSHLPCSICSRMKKAAMNEVAHRLHFNKVAFAHHKDDAVETLFMNMIHGGRIATFEPKMYLERSKITFIRPLVLAEEKDLSRMAKEEEMPVLQRYCPADGHTERQWAKDFLSSIYKKYPESESNFKEMLSNYDGLSLFTQDIELETEIDPRFSLSPLLTAKELMELQKAFKDEPEKIKRLKPEHTTYLIRFKHRIVGEISILNVNPHQVDIMSLAITKKHLSSKSILLEQVLLIYEKMANPILFVYHPSDKKTAISLGFIKKKEPNVKEGSYILKVKR